MKSSLFIAVLSTLLISACGQASSSVGSSPPSGEPPGAEEPDVATGVRCEVLSFDRTQGSYATARFRATNEGDIAVAYRGYGPQSPVYTCEVLENGAWEEKVIGWCGTGLEEQVLAPGASIEITLTVELDGRPQRFRFGQPAIVTPAVGAESH